MPRFNLYPAANAQGATRPGISTGEAITAVEEVLCTTLPEGFSYGWTELSPTPHATGPWP